MEHLFLPKRSAALFWDGERSMTTTKYRITWFGTETNLHPVVAPSGCAPHSQVKPEWNYRRRKINNTNQQIHPASNHIKRYQNHIADKRLFIQVLLYLKDIETKIKETSIMCLTVAVLCQWSEESM